MSRPISSHSFERKLLKRSLSADEARDLAFRQMIRSVPKGQVSTYGRIAAAAGYPLYHRAVASLLRREASEMLPWQRIVGAHGEIKLRGDAALEQRLRLEMEGVRFRGARVDMEAHEYSPKSWLVPRHS